MDTMTSTATKTVSGTKLAIATLAMLAAGSAAFVMMPTNNNNASYKWGGCVDPDSYVDEYAMSNPFTTKQLFTKSDTNYNAGSKSDYCYTFPTTGKTYLVEGICRNGTFGTWQKNCAELNSTKPGANFKCVEGACVDVPNNNSDSSYGYGWQEPTPAQNAAYACMNATFNTSTYQMFTSCKDKGYKGICLNATTPNLSSCSNETGIYCFSNSSSTASNINCIVSDMCKNYPTTLPGGFCQNLSAYNTTTNAQAVTSTALIISNLVTNQLDGVDDSVYPLQNGTIEVGRISFFNPPANSVKLKSLTIKETKTNVYTRNWYLKNSDNNTILSTGSKSGDMISFNNIDYNFENKGNVIIYATVAMGVQNAATLNLKLQDPNAINIIYNDNAQVAVFGNTFPYNIRTLQK